MEQVKKEQRNLKEKEEQKASSSKANITDLD